MLGQRGFPGVRVRNDREGAPSFGFLGKVHSAPELAGDAPRHNGRVLCPGRHADNAAVLQVFRGELAACGNPLRSRPKDTSQ
jgi:hypothetical protein